MVINEKALVRQVKEAYKEDGYTVAVTDGRMMLTADAWLALIAQDNAPNGLLALLAGHIRDVPKEGEAYRVIKTKDGPFVQACILEDAAARMTSLFELKAEQRVRGAKRTVRCTDLVLQGYQLWQERPGNGILTIDPRLAALIKNYDGIVRLSNGIYAEGEISELWVLRVAEGDAAEKLRHLERIPWVK